MVANSRARRPQELRAAPRGEVSERSQPEEALRESDDRFRTFANAAFEGIFIHENGKILDANETLCTLCGHELSDLIGMDGLNLVAPECRDLGRRNIISDYAQPYEVTGVRNDGA